MKNKLIISASGLDRNGIVSEISSIINNYNANIETSRMVRLGEQFTTLILIHIDSKYIGNLKFDLENIKNLNIETFQLNLLINKQVIIFNYLLMVLIMKELFMRFLNILQKNL